MPIYEYECPKCGVFEVQHSASDKPLKAKPGCCEKNCPKKATRLISASAFHLKGGGWYKSDYGSSGSGSSGSGSSGSSGKSGSDGGSEGSSSADSGDGGGEKKKKKAPCGPACGCH